MQNALRGEALTSLSTLHIAFLLQIGLEGFDVNRSQFPFWRQAKTWDTSMWVDATVTGCAFGCKWATNVNREPVFKILRHRHLGRIDVGAFVAGVEEAI